MNKFINILVVAGLTLGSISTANAAINARQLNQQRLIDAGYRSGKLTYQEKARLRAQQRAITRQEARMSARGHGRLSKRDLRILHALQAQAKRDIQREKYDAQRGRNRFKI